MKSRAAIHVGHGQPLVVDEINIPDPQPDQVIVKLYSSGVCHSQLHQMHNIETKTPGKLDDRVCYIAKVVETWKLLLIALGAAMFLEGLPYFISPRGARRVLAQLLVLSEGNLRLIGFVLMTGGLFVAWVATR